MSSAVDADMNAGSSLALGTSAKGGVGASVWVGSNSTASITTAGAVTFLALGLALAVGLGGFGLWASLAPLDEGVPTHGMVANDTKRKAVQHPS